MKNKIESVNPPLEEIQINHFNKNISASPFKYISEETRDINLNDIKNIQANYTNIMLHTITQQITNIEQNTPSPIHFKITSTEAETSLKPKKSKNLSLPLFKPIAIPNSELKKKFERKNQYLDIINKKLDKLNMNSRDQINVLSNILDDEEIKDMIEQFQEHLEINIIRGRNYNKPNIRHHYERPNFADV